MPSLQSYFFRVMTKVLSLRMNAITSIPKLRDFSNKIYRSLLLPDGVTSQRLIVNGVSVEWIVPPSISLKSVILYLHGGAWVLGWYKNHRSLVAYIGQASQSRVLSVDYRLAPENPFPAALEDSLTAYRWLLKDGIEPNQIVIAGDSAGGNLALAMLMALRDAGDPLPAAAVCISPMTDLAGTGETLHRNKDVLLTAEFALSMARHYIGTQDACLPLISPHYGDMTGLPPLLIHAGEDEILLSDAKRLADNARNAGVDVTLVVWPRMWHVWHIYVPYLPEAKRAVHAISRFVRQHVVSDKASL